MGQEGLRVTAAGEMLRGADGKVRKVNSLVLLINLLEEHGIQESSDMLLCAEGRVLAVETEKLYGVAQLDFRGVRTMLLQIPTEVDLCEHKAETGE